MKDFDDLPLLSEEEEKRLEESKLPFGGLLGNSVHLRVLREIVADPWRDFKPKNLKLLTSASAPRIKDSLETLASLGLLKNVSDDQQRPVYKANLEDIRLTALTFLAYAATDARDGTNFMDEAIRFYCDEELPNKYEWLLAGNNHGVTFNQLNFTTYQVIMSPASEQKPIEEIELTKESLIAAAQGA
jgi:hypothetical protein